jgi:hypothetical protein
MYVFNDIPIPNRRMNSGRSAIDETHRPVRRGARADRDAQWHRDNGCEPQAERPALESAEHGLPEGALLHVVPELGADRRGAREDALVDHAGDDQELDDRDDRDGREHRSEPREAATGSGRRAVPEPPDGP